MAQKKRPSSGRVTPKGTKNPDPKAKRERPGMPEQPNRPPHELAGKAGKQSHKAMRPITHNRGNR